MLPSRPVRPLSGAVRSTSRERTPAPATRWAAPALGLLAGAARAFAEHGLRRSTMQSVAAAAGVAKATLYNHFRTKDEVAAALLAVELDRLSALAAGAAARAGAGGALRRARRPPGAPPAGRDRTGGPDRAARRRTPSGGRS